MPGGQAVMPSFKICFSVMSLLVAGLCIQPAVHASETKDAPGEKAMQETKSIDDFEMKDIDGHPVSLKDFKGKVLLLVNVASRCGYTGQYAGLQEIYSKYKDQGFAVLGFPANNFMGQEPGTNEEIKQFCTLKYNVTFPMFSKISVKGEDIHPLYQYLTSDATNPEFAGDISWNFNKFLVDKNGRVVARFKSGDKPGSETVVSAVEKALKG
jgi:glutathione peroxidase